MKDKFSVYDTHTHSRHSFDGRDSVEEMCRAAQKTGLAGICITDHYEVGSALFVPKEQRDPYWIKESFAAVAAEKGRHGDLDILAGVELGQYVHDPARADEIISLCPFDFVLGSMHFSKDGVDFYAVDFTKVDPAPIYAAYLDDLLETALTADFDSLAHMTYPLRYVRRDGAGLDLQPFDSMHDKILSALARRGKALELNTSGVNYPSGFLMPEENLVRRFKELGGQYVTLGSDAHRAEHIAAGFERGLEVLRAAGFERPTAFAARRPI